MKRCRRMARLNLCVSSSSSSGFLLRLLSRSTLFQTRNFARALFRKIDCVSEKCHLHHPLSPDFWTHVGTSVMALSVLLCIGEEKALFVGARPFSSGIIGEAIKTAVIFPSGAACAQATVHSCTCAFDFETPLEKNFRFHTRSLPFSRLPPDIPRYPSSRFPVPSVCF
jgi:hypothetical protein